MKCVCESQFFYSVRSSCLSRESRLIEACRGGAGRLSWRLLKVSLSDSRILAPAFLDSCCFIISSRGAEFIYISEARARPAPSGRQNKAGGLDLRDEPRTRGVDGWNGKTSRGRRAIIRDLSQDTT